jgi:hypothetical protein
MHCKWSELLEDNIDSCIYQDYPTIAQKAVFSARLMLTPQPVLLLVYLVMLTYFLTIPVPLLVQAHSSESI